MNFIQRVLLGVSLSVSAIGVGSARADIFTGTLEYQYTATSARGWLGWPDGTGGDWGFGPWEPANLGVPLNTPLTATYQYESPTIDGEFRHSVVFSPGTPFWESISGGSKIFQVSGGEIVAFSGGEPVADGFASFGSGRTGTFSVDWSFMGGGGHWMQGTYTISNPVSSTPPPPPPPPPPSVPDATNVATLLLGALTLIAACRRAHG